MIDLMTVTRSHFIEKDLTLQSQTIQTLISGTVGGHLRGSSIGPPDKFAHPKSQFHNQNKKLRKNGNFGSTGKIQSLTRQKRPFQK